MRIPSLTQTKISKLLLNAAYGFLGVLLSIQVALANDYQSARTAGLGGAGRAGPYSNDSLYLNPSFGSFLQTQSILASYQNFQATGGNSGHKGRVVHASIFDGKSELFHGALGYTNRPGLTMIHAMGSRGFFERTGFGISSKAYFKPGGDFHFDGAFSFSWVPLDWLQSCVMIDNIIQKPEGLEFQMYRTISLGTKFNVSKILLIYADPIWTPGFRSGKKLGFSLGVEFAAFGDLYFRTGYFKNSLVPFQNSHSDGYALGLGWFGPRFSFDYAFQRALINFPEQPQSNSHVFSFLLFF